ncbi:DnaD domain protein [Enterococcus thailandicus]|uniref:DNA replication protein DnaD n=1 Tax=Enterococcus thailandicus TaxID=417368 RepID=A0A179ETJ6_ENTTH|nr:DnaD domain protein [Enterococcus thailandicus]ASZ07699.1 DNA replication protein DnaD [Enterococcus thailandicus]MDT2750606.1 DnaD domain protein [Enterococcus thailandicus]MDT2775165.1 DnaD domain protein [Enterococcus thailandicus]MDT2793661.1 DnaD domain protein [Enterococcus thailandicus]OAQ56538.1 DNA replication protein DnaD [Enterococcus thailandicus]
MLSLTKYLQSGQTTISNLLFVNYRKMGLESEEFLFVLQLHMKQQEGDSFPDLQLIAINMGLKSDQVYQILNRLVSGGFIAIETITVEGKKADQYNLLPLYERLEKYLDSQASKAKENQQEQEIQSVYRSFEQEFGRPLSAIEFQRIGQWLEEDHYQPEVLKLALREAVLNQAYSFNYVDRILLSWERKNLRTKQQVEEEQKRRKQQLLQKEVEQSSQSEDLPKVSLTNWLEEELRNETK